MKVLTVKNPWAWAIIQRAELVVNGNKDVENRTRRTNYRGQILIHASKKPDKKVWAGGYHQSEYKNGCILGSVEITDCVQNSTSRWAEKDRWHWILKNPKPLAVPIPAKGKLGRWEYAPKCTECARINPSSKIDFLPICESDYKAGSCSTFTAANAPLTEGV
jgi:hypothetical protein